MKKVDLNCDLGESFGNYKLGMDEQILPLITSANIACGFHASDPVVMSRTVKMAAESGVAAGAHPGYQDLVGFGKDETLRRLALHPALDRIRAYDRKKSTDYYHMLKVYLQCERERVLTSRKLFVHKNTLVYRLKKMVSLFALQLDEIYEREYLMASFLCLEQEEKAE